MSRWAWLERLRTGSDAAAATPVNAANSGFIETQQLGRGSLVWDALTGGGGVAGLPSVTRSSAMQISAVWACVSLIAGAISMLPLHIYRNKGGGERERDYEHPLWWMFNEQFCPRWSGSAGWEYLALSRLFEGDCYALIQRDRMGKVIGLVPWHPSRVWATPLADGSRLVYVFYPEPNATDAQTLVLDQDDVLHVPGLGFDGIRSLSPLRNALRMSGAVTLAAQESSAQFFANGQRPDYVLVTKDGVTLNLEQKEELREQIAAHHARSRGMGHRPLLLSGMTPMPLSLSNEDAELLGTRQFQVEEIARAFGVPPFMIGHNEKTTGWGSGVAEMGTGFVRYVLRPHLNAFQNEINRKIFRGPQMAADFDTFELERADLKSLFEAFRIAMGRAGEPGFMSADEVRSLINMSKVEGGDQLHRPAPAAGGQNAPQQAA